MAETDKLFAGSIPELYDRYLVPLIFNAYALDHAKARQSQDDRIEWKQADALALPFEEQNFDAVVCQFGAMFFPDKVQAYKEARRVLKPGGCFLFTVWDKISENEFADVVTQTLAAVFPNDPPRFLARTPHGYHDVEHIRAELNAAGFANVSVEAVEHRSKASSPSDPAIGFCQGTPLRMEIEARDSSRLQDATQLVAEAVARQFGTGAVDGRIQAYVISATR